jgi:chromosome segregation ATPase
VINKNLEERIKSLQSLRDESIQKYEQFIETLKTREQEYTNETQKLNKTIDSLSADLTDSRKSYELTKAKMEKLESEVISKANTIQNLQNSSKELMSSIAQANIENGNITKKVCF